MNQSDIIPMHVYNTVNKILTACFPKLHFEEKEDLLQQLTADISNEINFRVKMKLRARVNVRKLAFRSITNSKTDKNMVPKNNNDDNLENQLNNQLDNWTHKMDEIFSPISYPPSPSLQQLLQGNEDGSSLLCLDETEIVNNTKKKI